MRTGGIKKQIIANVELSVAPIKHLDRHFGQVIGVRSAVGFAQGFAPVAKKSNGTGRDGQGGESGRLQPIPIDFMDAGLTDRQLLPGSSGQCGMGYITALSRQLGVQDCNS